jgi:glycosyltransferase involved in cell wall biosynthesis
MENIKVCLRMTSHPLYQDLLKYPPSGVEYEIPKTASTQGNSKTARNIKKWLWMQYTKYNIPQIGMQNSSDIIYSMGGTLLKTGQPWIVDAEHVAGFSNFHEKVLMNNKRAIEKILLSDNCKKIMPWSFAAKKTIWNFFSNRKIDEKTEVVYPAVQERKIKKTKSEPIRFLFIGRTFYEKCGPQMLKAFESISKKYDAELTMATVPPEEYARKYEGFEDIRFVKPNKSREELILDFYSNADVYVMPSFVDTLGGVFLESMSCSIPVITTNIYASHEIIENGKSGILMDAPFSMFNPDFSLRFWPKDRSWQEFLNNAKIVNGKFVTDIEKSMAALINDSSLRKSMGKRGERIIKEKFSISRRNKTLKRIYEEAIR